MPKPIKGKETTASADSKASIAEDKLKMLERELQAKNEELSRLKAENVKLQAKNNELQRMYDQQIKEIQEASIHRLSFRPQDLTALTIQTDREDVADTTKRALLKLGVDFDYRVRKGIIEVTTAV